MRRHAKPFQVWKMVLPFLPEEVGALEVDRIAVKFRLTPKGRMQASVAVRYVKDRLTRVSAGMERPIEQPYALFEALRKQVEIPAAMTKLDIIIKPGEIVLFRGDFWGILKEETSRENTAAEAESRDEGKRGIPDVLAGRPAVQEPDEETRTAKDPAASRD